LDEIVAEIIAGSTFLARTIAALGGDGEPDRGVRMVRRRHLTRWRCRKKPARQRRRGDLWHLRFEPIRYSYLNESFASMRRCPIAIHPSCRPEGPMKALALTARRRRNLPLLRGQTADFAGHRPNYGLPVSFTKRFPGRSFYGSWTNAFA